jgi:hypothetical protein
VVADKNVGIGGGRRQPAAVDRIVEDLAASEAGSRALIPAAVVAATPPRNSAFIGARS